MKFFFLSLLFIIFYLSAYTQPETVVQFGHLGYAVNEMAISDDDKYLASTDGQVLKIWDLRSGLEYRTVAIESNSFGGIKSLNFSEDVKSLLYSSGSDIIRLDIIKGNMEKTFSLSNNDTEIKEDMDKEELKKIFEESPLGFIYSPDKSIFAFNTLKKVTIVNSNTGKTINDIRIDSDGGALLRLLFGSQNFLEIAEGNEFIRIDSMVYSIKSKKGLYPINTIEEGFELSHAHFSKDGSKLFVAGYIKKESTSGMEGKYSLRDILNQANEYYLSKIEQGLIVVLDVPTGKILNRIKTKPIFSLTFSPDGTQLAALEANEKINLYNAETLELSKSLQYEKEQLPMVYGIFKKIPPLLFSKDGNNLYFGGTCGNGMDITQYDLQSNAPARSLGAAIPPITLKPMINLSDSIILKELETVASPIMSAPSKEYDKGFRILDLLTAKVPTVFAKSEAVIFSPNRKYLLMKKINEPIKVFTTEFNELVATLESSSANYDRIVFSPKGSYVAAVQGIDVLVWDVGSRAQIQTLSGHKKQVRFIDFSESESIICTTSEDETVKFWSVDDGKMIAEQKAKIGIKKIGNGIRNISESLGNVGSFFGKKNKLTDTAAKGELVGKGLSIAGDIFEFSNYNEITMSPNGEKIALWGNDHATVHFYDLKKKKVTKKIRDLNILIMQQAIGPMINGKSIEESKENSERDSMQLNNDEELMNTFLMDYFNSSNLKEQSVISPDWTKIARATKKFMSKEKPSIKIDYTTKGRKKKSYKLIDSDQHMDGIAFSPNGKMIAASGSSSNSIRIWNADNGDVIKDLYGHSGTIAFGPNNKIIISKGWDKQIKIWDIESEKVLYSFIGIQGENDYVVLLPSGHYTASRKNSNAIAFRYGDRVYPFEQFDLIYNRPDLILSTLGSTSTTTTNKDNVLIDAYKKAHETRLSRFNLSDSLQNGTVNLPSVQFAKLPLISTNRDLDISFSAKDASHALSNINIFVNGVPIYGRTGKDIKSLNTKSFNDFERITLSNGRNILQLFAINDQGIRSLMDQLTIEYSGPSAASQTHLVLVGASGFSDDGIVSLDYPIQDLQDIETQFKSSKTHKNLTVHRLLDQNFTLEGFKKLKNDLSKTNVDDKVLFFFATHGFLNADLDYYLTTYDTDHNTPSKSGLSFSVIEDLLDAIPARSKAVFIDACHAGEVDATAEIIGKKKKTIDGSVKFRSMGTMNWGESAALSNLEQMKSLFVGLRKSTGTTVIASAASTEAAIEGEVWNNSVFTYAFIKGTVEMQADSNKDGVVTVSELQQYLPVRVSRLTSGKQVPTFRYENILNDFVIW